MPSSSRGKSVLAIVHTCKYASLGGISEYCRWECYIFKRGYRWTNAGIHVLSKKQTNNRVWESNKRSTAGGCRDEKDGEKEIGSSRSSVRD